MPPSLSADPDRLLGLAELADHLGVKPSTIRQWRLEKRGPVAVRVGGGLRWRAGDVAEFVDRARERDPARVLADLEVPLRDAETAVAHAQITAGDDTTRRHLSVAAHALREVRDRLASTGTTTPQGENDE